MSKFKSTDEFKGIVERADFLRRSYVGGKEYREGRYLLRHERESEQDYKRRLAQANYTNFCGSIIDAYINYLYRDAPKRDLEQFDASILLDVDLKGRDLDSYVRYVCRVISAQGTAGIIVDKPDGIYETQQQELDAGVRPYCVTYTVDDIVNRPTYEMRGGVPVMTEIVLRDGMVGKSRYYKVWTENEWLRYEQKGQAEPKLIATGEHGLGVVPFIAARNRDSGDRFLGVSDISDIAEANQKVYYLDANSLSIIERTAFPMFETADNSSAGNGNAPAGEGNIITYDSDTPSARSGWVEPTGSSLKEIREDRRDTIENIWRLSKLGQNEANKITEASGVSLELRFQQLNALLSEKAEAMEDIENKIFSLMALWNNEQYTGTVEYPRKFGIRDLNGDIDTALKASTLIPSKTFRSEMAKKLAAQVLKTDDGKLIDQISAELEGGNVQSIMEAINA